MSEKIGTTTVFKNGRTFPNVLSLLVIVFYNKFDANKNLIEIFEAKIKDKIQEVWGET